MKSVSIIAVTALALATVASVVLIVNRRRADWDRQMRDSSKSRIRSPYSSLITEKLVEHDGEESPILHAFEEALEVEMRLEQQLAKETGLQAS